MEDVNPLGDMAHGQYLQPKAQSSYTVSKWEVQDVVCCSSCRLLLRDEPTWAWKQLSYPPSSMAAKPGQPDSWRPHRAASCPGHWLTQTYDRSGNPTPTQCKHTQSYPSWKHSRPLAWNLLYLGKKKKIKMIWASKKGHVAKAMEEVWFCS